MENCHETKTVCQRIDSMGGFIFRCGTIAVSDQQFDILTRRQDSVPASTEEPAASVTEVRLAYDSGDSLNPYWMTSQLNMELVPLLYDGLVRPDKTLKPENLLAQG
jgi:peptide/nickel transport system substrate-binding protein